jgi:hypothetical protein
MNCPAVTPSSVALVHESCTLVGLVAVAAVIPPNVGAFVSWLVTNESWLFWFVVLKMSDWFSARTTT